jgi:transcription antitermination factor NusG
VSNLQAHLETTAPVTPLGVALKESNWYAIHTMPRHEKWIAGQLHEKRVFTFLPVLHQIHRWSDRRSKVEVPMFSCYVFVRMVHVVEERLKVLRTPGVFGFVGSERQGTPIPDEQIESLRTAIRGKIPCVVHPFVSAGKRVRIRGGSLDGVEGILIGQGGEQSVVVSVELLRRSVSIRVEGYDIEAVS